KILSNFLLLRYLKKIFYNSVAELRFIYYSNLCINEAIPHVCGMQFLLHNGVRPNSNWRYKGSYPRKKSDSRCGNPISRQDLYIIRQSAIPFNEPF
ncbi:hypothetical protein, partial [Parabacteroides johnsonii]|uniref:hypothetical protein n=1 Tax=Parabacteroides johnsonii TaxID=387661 RepID=UPI003562E348